MNSSAKKAILSLVFALAGQLAQSAGIGYKLIAGSAHDFSATGAGGAAGYEGENGVTYLTANKCTTCHAAHKPAKTAFLWKRTLGAGPGWTVWDGAAGKVLDGVNDGEYLSVAEFAQTGSAMCLSCHDGVTAIGGTTMRLAFRGAWGRNLPDMHPVAKRVPFGSDGWQPDLTAGNSSAFGNSNVVVDTVGNSSYVGCTSCHSMHSSPSAATYLRKGESCLVCHNR